MEKTKKVNEVNPWAEIARYQKTIVDATNEILKIVPAIAVQPLVAALNDQLGSAVNSIMAAEMEKLEGKTNANA